MCDGESRTFFMSGEKESSEKTHRREIVCYLFISRFHSIY